MAAPGGSVKSRMQASLNEFSTITRWATINCDNFVVGADIPNRITLNGWKYLDIF